MKLKQYIDLDEVAALASRAEDYALEAVNLLNEVRDLIDGAISDMQDRLDDLDEAGKNDTDDYTKLDEACDNLDELRNYVDDAIDAAENADYGACTVYDEINALQ